MTRNAALKLLESNADLTAEILSEIREALRISKSDEDGNRWISSDTCWVDTEDDLYDNPKDSDGDPWIPSW
jgi:hypothetical protein